MWVIENLDDAGEGIFCCEAKSKKEALRMHEEKNKGMKVTRCKRLRWVDLALVTGERGQIYYFERGRADGATR